MSGTYLRITADEFSLECPHCEGTLLEVFVHRLYELTFECPHCLAEVQLCVTLNPA